MNSYYQNRKMPFSNPVANALVVLVGALAIGASLLLGFIAFLALGTLVLVLAAIVGIRVWWFNRSLRRRGHGGRAAPADPAVKVEVIEGEFRIVQPPDRSETDRET